MSGGLHTDDSEGGTPPRLSLGQRLLILLPRMRQNREEPLLDRLKGAMLKPAPPGANVVAPGEPATVEELEAAVKYANDRERIVGLIAAPLAAAIGILVTGDLIANDPPTLINGHLNRLHQSVTIYQELGTVVLVLSILMLVFAFFRKRLFLGMVMALYGLGIFNLHYWGFGIPFILGASWYLVRAYRLQRDLGEANGTRPSRSGSEGRSRRTTNTRRPRPNKRYTPPT